MLLLPTHAGCCAHESPQFHARSTHCRTINPKPAAKVTLSPLQQGPCNPCAAGSFCPGRGVAVQLCPTHATSPASSTSAYHCRCDSGRYQNCTVLSIGGNSQTYCTCESSRACFAGTFASLQGGFDVCKPCPAGSFCPGGVAAASSYPCGSGATSAVGSTAVGHCICPAGYTGNASGGWGCTACTAGHYKNWTGTGAISNAACNPLPSRTTLVDVLNPYVSSLEVCAVARVSPLFLRAVQVCHPRGGSVSCA